MHSCAVRHAKIGALAHLARALDWQSKGDRFESDMLHIESGCIAAFLLLSAQEKMPFSAWNCHGAPSAQDLGHFPARQVVPVRQAVGIPFCVGMVLMQKESDRRSLSFYFLKYVNNSVSYSWSKSTSEKLFAFSSPSYTLSTTGHFSLINLITSSSPSVNFSKSSL